MRYGYGRVSKKNQNLALQLHALKQDGCEKIYWEKRSGKTLDGPRLKKVISKLAPGDVLVFWMIDRLGRDARELINLAYDLRDRGIIIRSLTQSIDTTTLEGQCDFIDECSKAQKERAKISKRTTAGLAEARRRGKRLGRPKALSPKRIERAKLLRETEELSYARLATRLRASQSTLWRALSDAHVQH